MKKKHFSSISSLKEIEHGKLTGGFETITPSKLLVVLGGTGDNTNCTGANCIPGCTTINLAAGCTGPRP